MTKINPFIRKMSIAPIIIGIISGCGSDLPKVKGEYRPINKDISIKAETNTPQIFDFKFKGTATDALYALQSKQSRLEVQAPQGRVILTKVELDLRQVSLESALRVLGLQGASTFDVVHKSDPESRTDSAYIKFLR